MRRWLLRLLFLAAVAGLAAHAGPAPQRGRRAGGAAGVAARSTTRDERPTPAVPPSPEEVPPSARWSDPVEKACPPGFEVKVKLASGIYHLPGMFAYDRTIPDRCYASAEAAEADGFRAAKR